jgi:hypothetical protein
MKTLKYEEVYRQDYRDLAEARASVERFIEKVYNVKRLHSALSHSALGYRPPIEFERLLPTSLLLVLFLNLRSRQTHEKRGHPQNAFS